MNRGILVGAAVGAVALALGAVLLVRSESAADANLPLPAPSSAAAPLRVPAPSASAPGAVTPPGGLPLNTPAAPWLAPGGERASPRAAPVPPAAAGGTGVPTIEDIQARAQALGTGKKANAREIDALLADMQKNQGRNVVAGVDLQALRDNLARSERIQQLALEIQALAATPGAATPAQLQTRLDELQQLQAALTASVTVPAAATPPAGAIR